MNRFIGQFTGILSVVKDAIPFLGSLEEGYSLLTTHKYYVRIVEGFDALVEVVQAFSDRKIDAEEVEKVIDELLDIPKIRQAVAKLDVDEVAAIAAVIKRKIESTTE